MKDILAKLEKEIQKRGISESQISEILSSVPEVKERRIIGGYASVAIIDREGQRIPIPALKNAVTKFMEQPFYRPANIYHSNVTVGRILPKWTNPETGEVVKTTVDDKGWWVVCEVRSDVEVADKVWQEIEKGNLRSFSISGSAKRKSEEYKNGQRWTDVDELELAECTICFPGETMISTSEGLIPISDVKVGDKVWTEKNRLRLVTQTFQHNIGDNLIEIISDKGTLRVTNNHLVLTQNRGWVRAKDLLIGDDI